MSDLLTPRHIAIIMDGNGRWAQEKKLPRYMGHKRGADSVKKIVEWGVEHQLEVLTLFAFSSENWLRPQEEVNMLMELFLLTLKVEVSRLNQHNVKLKVIGDCAAFSAKLQKKIKQSEVKTANNTGLVLQIAANYGGKWDITQAVSQLVAKSLSGDLSLTDITETTLAQHLSFSALPDPDLFIRTGGEKRLSNFLLWQTAYSELYFTDVLWPDFDAQCLDQAVSDYQQRQRRFGQTQEQVKSS